MKIAIPLQERHGRDAEIIFEDRLIDRECPENLKNTLENDLQALLKVFGALTISVVEDNLHPVSGRSRIMDDVMGLLEQYGISKIQSAAKFHKGPNSIQ